MIFSEATCKFWTPRILGILRIVTGFLFLQHGTAKLLGTPHVAMFDNLQLVSLLGLAGILELAGGLLILGLLLFLVSASISFGLFFPGEVLQRYLVRGIQLGAIR